MSQQNTIEVDGALGKGWDLIGAAIKGEDSSGLRRYVAECIGTGKDTEAINALKCTEDEFHKLKEELVECWGPLPKRR